MQAMDRRSPGLSGMHAWVEDQRRRGLFQGDVYGPLAAEMTVRDALSHAAPLEAVSSEVHQDLGVTALEGGLAIGLLPIHTLHSLYTCSRPVQACKSMLTDFAVTCRADEELVTEELRRRNLNQRVHAFSKPLDTPYVQMAGPASRYKQ